MEKLNKLRHLASAFCLACVFAFALLLPFGGPKGFCSSKLVWSTVLAAEESEAQQESEAPDDNQGWGRDDGGVYYLKDGARLTGMQSLDNGTYYFNNSGYRCSGPVRVSDTVYFFDYTTGKLKTGIVGLYEDSHDADILYCFNAAKDGSLVAGKWANLNGKRYYADENGQIHLGTITVNGKLYHITKKGRMTSYGKSSYDGKYYFARSNGSLKTGLQYRGTRLYYFNPQTGARQTGSIKIGGYTYYFSTKNGRARTGWVKLSSGSDGYKYYYYNKSGHRLSGLKTINGKKYYLNPDDNDARVEDCWFKVGKYTYYFNSKGVAQTGFIKQNGKTYYTNAKGIRKKGWVTVGGQKYYFSKKTYAMKTGWFTSKGKTYYLNPSTASSSYGAAVTGWAKLNGNWYYFNSDGTMRTGWLTDNMKKYYFDPSTGIMCTGQKTIDGVTYDFGTSGAISLEIEGSYSIQVNRTSCFVVIYKGSTPVKAFVCSAAADITSTPSGTFTILDKLRWHELMGPSWGQYCEHITEDILFHSVTYSQLGNIYSLDAAAYNKLGSPASHGCIRLTVKHAKWIYDNIPIGTKVTISDSVEKPTNIVIEQAEKIPLTQTYDPTDPAV